VSIDIPSDDDNILRPQFGEAKLVVDRKDDPICLHQYVAIKRNAEIVVCRVCRREVDPFDVLLDMATDWERVTHWERELERLAEREAELKREEANTKSRLRAAHKLGAPHPRAQVFVDEMLRRLSEACDHQAIWDARRFADEFKWLEAEQQKAIADAYFAAEQRAELTARTSPKRKKRIRVIKGGGT